MKTLPKNTFRFIFFFVQQQWIKFSYIILAFIIWSASNALFPYLIKRIVNTLQFYHGTRAGVFTAVSGSVFMIVLIWVLAEILMRTQGFIQAYTLPRFRANIREAVFEYIKSHSHEFFSSHFSGSISKKLSDLPSSCQTLVEIACFQFSTIAIGVLLVFIMMWFTKPFFAFVLLAWVSLHLGVTLLYLHRNSRLWAAHANSAAILNGKTVDILTNILSMRLFARGNYETQYLQQFQTDELEKAKKALFLVEIMRIFQGLSGLFLIFSMVFGLLYSWSYHAITLGDFTQILMQSFWLLEWIWFISFQLTVFAREAGTVTDALSLIQKAHDVVDKPHAPALFVKQGQIKFESIDFYYRASQPVFNHLNLLIPAGQKVGLVGFSGSGKSSFVNLLLRFYDPQSGRILIDEQDISEVQQDSLRSHITVIPQDPTLFHRSLMDNIRYGRLEASEAEVTAAAKLAHCHEFIEKLDNGYYSLIGERGIKLSGGQRQRIAIARAILKNAPILILDEATSALDSATERLIQEGLQTLMQGKTTIVIAHRLSTLANMDRILVFDKGHIIEDGTIHELKQKNGHFAMLWSMQTDNFLQVDTYNDHHALTH